MKALADLEAEYRGILDREYKHRVNRKKRYSLRAFARFLKVDPTFLSKLMAGKLLLSLDQADNITARLELKKEERDKFLLSAAEEQKCHALYLIDPSLTDCDPGLDETNKLPARGRKKS